MIRALIKPRIRYSASNISLRELFLRFVAASLLGVTLLAVGVPTKDVIASPSPAFVYPLMGTEVSSAYGDRLHPITHTYKHHDGIDLAAPNGSPIRAIADGVVIFSDTYAGYGQLVVVEHANGLTSHYGHLSAYLVHPGQHVKAGEVIARVGSTGISTGPHLHFEIRVNGVPQDPQRFIPGLALPGRG